MEIATAEPRPWGNIEDMPFRLEGTGSWKESLPVVQLLHKPASRKDYTQD